MTLATAPAKGKGEGLEPQVRTRPGNDTRGAKTTFASTVVAINGNAESQSDFSCCPVAEHRLRQIRAMQSPTAAPQNSCSSEALESKGRTFHKVLVVAGTLEQRNLKMRSCFLQGFLRCPALLLLARVLLPARRDIVGSHALIRPTTMYVYRAAGAARRGVPSALTWSRVDN